MRVISALAAALAVVSVNGRLAVPGPAPGPAPAPAMTAGDMCRELCKKDTGMDADFADCMTECNVYTDTAPSMEDATGAFAADESYNEAGGEAMAEKYENITGKEVPSCTPTVDAEKQPTFDEVDANGDGGISEDEAIAWGDKACIPDEMIRQLFSDTDANRDMKIDSAEWDVSGEDTEMENKIDDVADKRSEGDDQYHEVHMPKFDVFDLNDDGKLEESEVFDAFMFEMKQRIAMYDISEEQKMSIIQSFKKEVSDAFKLIDMNGDGTLSEDEYYRVAKAADMGDEFSEAAQADEDAEDPDDMGRDEALAGGPAPGPAPAGASLLSLARRIKAHKQRVQQPVDEPTVRVPAPALVQLWKDAVTCMGAGK